MTKDGHYHDVIERNISIPKATCDLILKEKNSCLLLGLYSFYYYTAIWQNTNQPFATTGYTAKGLGLSEVRVRGLKKALKKLGLVEDYTKRGKDNKIIGHFIRVKYFEKNHPSRNPQGGLPHTVEKIEGNALSTNNRNALSTNTHLGVAKRKRHTLIQSTTTFDEKLAVKLKEVIDSKGKLTRVCKLSTWIRELTNIRLKGGYTKEVMKKVVVWYIKNIDDKYTPQIYKVKDLADKFKRIVDAMERTSVTSSTPLVASQQAITIADNLQAMGYWPNGSDVVMAEVVELSLQNHKLYLAEHKRLLDALKGKRDNKSKQLLMFVKHINNDELLDSDWFIEHLWFGGLYNYLKNRPNSNIFNYAFNTNQQYFDSIGYKWANNYTGSGKVWAMYKKALAVG